jgi:hypothetical protein
MSTWHTLRVGSGFGNDWDLFRQQKRKYLDPERDQNDADPQHWLLPLR